MSRLKNSLNCIGLIIKYQRREREEINLQIIVKSLVISKTIKKQFTSHVQINVEHLKRVKVKLLLEPNLSIEISVEFRILTL